MRKVLISGSRKITDPSIVFPILDRHLTEGDKIIVGDATGVDILTHAYVHFRGLAHFEPYVPEWGLGRGAALEVV